MSGGSLDYLYSDVREAAGSVGHTDHLPEDLRGAFADHLRDVADVLKAVEWAMSYDTSPEPAQEAVEAFFDDLERPDLPLRSAIESAEETSEMLERAIERAEEAS